MYNGKLIKPTLTKINFLLVRKITVTLTSNSQSRILSTSSCLLQLFPNYGLYRLFMSIISHHSLCINNVELYRLFHLVVLFENDVEPVRNVFRYIDGHVEHR